MGEDGAGEIRVRSERPGDEARIAEITAAAFADHPHSDPSEPEIVAGLRRSGGLSVSLVAEIEGAVVGHIAFSPVRVGDGSSGWYGLGPVSVAPPFQRRGVGSLLVEAGLEALRGIGARGCVLLGNPRYYRRFGFVADPRLVYPGPPPELFQSLSLAGSAASGLVTYHPAFGGAS